MRSRLSAFFSPKRVASVRQGSVSVRRLRAAYEDLRLARKRAAPRPVQAAEAAWRAVVSEAVAGLVPYEEYVRELSLLGLKGVPFTGDVYSEALATKLGVLIRTVRPTNVAMDRRELGRATWTAKPPELLVEVPVRLGRGWLYQYTLLHEMGHIAAGHSPLPVDLPDDAPVALDPPPKRLARKPPLTQGLPKGALRDLYEAEAELRAQHGMLAGSLGELSLGTERLNQVS